MCGLKKLASQVFPENWKVLAERRRRRRQWRKRTKKKISPPVTQGDLMNGDIREICYEIKSNGFDNKIYLHFFAFENSGL